MDAQPADERPAVKDIEPMNLESTSHSPGRIPEEPPVSENQTSASQSPDFSKTHVIPGNETQGIRSDEGGQPEQTGCSRCGYILSGFSSTCPNCGHEQQRQELGIFQANAVYETNQDSLNIREFSDARRFSTESFEDDTSGHTVIERSGSFESGHSPWQGQASEIHPEDNHWNPGHTVRDHNYRGKFGEVQDSYDPDAEVSEYRSPIRLEAIYLGGNGEQQMVVNLDEKDKEHVLNRSNISEDDSTLSSDVHALIYRDGDKWIIENKASNKAVFLQVEGPCEIHNGDIIMLGGDKFYMFVDERKEK